MATASPPASSSAKSNEQQQSMVPFKLFGATISTSASAPLSDRASTAKSEDDEEEEVRMETSNDFEGESDQSQQTRKTRNKKRNNSEGCETSKTCCVKKPDKVIPCPRCDSLDTKFCYYNNYNVNQPRHFCKNCQRYWTAGGTLRNVPVGAGRRKNKHSHHNNNTNNTIANTSTNFSSSSQQQRPCLPLALESSPVLSFDLERNCNETSGERIRQVLRKRQSDEESSCSSSQWWINIMRAASASKSGTCSASSSWALQQHNNTQTAPVVAPVLEAAKAMRICHSEDFPMSLSRKAEDSSSSAILPACFQSFNEHDTRFHR